MKARPHLLSIRDHISHVDYLSTSSKTAGLVLFNELDGAVGETNDQNSNVRVKLALHESGKWTSLGRHSLDLSSCLITQQGHSTYEFTSGFHVLFECGRLPHPFDWHQATQRPPASVPDVAVFRHLIE